ncbi:MAG: hypothetical protein MZV70_19855 [Desulfobacterales bacterium]|nr:hypothetical protein [Desulfobacterales bacterium]
MSCASSRWPPRPWPLLARRKRRRPASRWRIWPAFRIASTPPSGFSPRWHPCRRTSAAALIAQPERLLEISGPDHAGGHLRRGAGAGLVDIGVRNPHRRPAPRAAAAGRRTGRSGGCARSWKGKGAAASRRRHSDRRRRLNSGADDGSGCGGSEPLFYAGPAAARARRRPACWSFSSSPCAICRRCPSR